MNRIFLLLTLCVASLAVQAQERTFGHRFVWAEHGLRLRSAPSLESEALLTIPAGEKVMLLANTEYVLDTVEGQAGQWVAIKFGEKTGFGFDVYLLPLPYPVGSVTLHDYLDTQLGKLATSASQTYYSDVSGILEPQLSWVEVERKLYAAGVCFTSYTGYEMWSWELRLPMLNMDQAYLFAKRFSDLAPDFARWPALPRVNTSLADGTKTTFFSESWPTDVLIQIQNGYYLFSQSQGAEEAILRWEHVE